MSWCLNEQCLVLPRGMLLLARLAQEAPAKTAPQMGKSLFWDRLQARLLQVRGGFSTPPQ